MRRPFSLLASGLVLLVGCGSSGNPAASGSGTSGVGTPGATSGSGSTSSGNDGPTGTASGSSSGGSGSGAGGNGGGASSSGSGTGGGSSDGKEGTFSFGLNAGYYNASLGDVAEAKLGLAAGANSERGKLTEPFLDQWGDAIRVPQNQQEIALGMQDTVCFLVGADVDHSNAPAGGNVENYSPKNLWEPIFTDAGDINPNNYWGQFVARVVKNYSPYIHTWEVWNEPDQVGGNWQATAAWSTAPPNPNDLIWWNDTIFAYIRMLRVTYAVVHKLDPLGKVTLGGIGYNSFLDALLRYTDEPTGGQVDAAHPSTGAAYFDVVSYHYYPVFTAGNSDAGAQGLIDALTGYQTTLAKYSVTGKSFIITESGAPRYALGQNPGGVDYAHDYLAKAMALAHDAGIRRIDWFILGDSADAGASQSSFDYVGLYQNLTPVTDPANAVITESGIAYATFGHLLAGSLSDPTATAQMNLAKGTKGVALTTSGGQRAYVVWAVGTDESATGTVTLPLSGDGKVYSWDYSKTQAAASVSPVSGKVTVNVTSAPAIVIGPK